MIEVVGGAGRTESELLAGASFCLNVRVRQALTAEAPVTSAVVPAALG